MTRDYRIKTYEFAQTAITTASGTGAVASEYTAENINGEILSISWKANTAGSLMLLASGTNEVLWFNKTPSGTNVQFAYPFVYGNTNAANTTGSPQAYFSPVAHNILVLAGSGFEGGSVAYGEIKYR